ncbi:hypothetical protein FRC12_024198 [Ceratobasidium sp. 428]|nr:hypothetical protein FRC12_024198 [Ceratobasidium sp. 428]
MPRKKTLQRAWSESVKSAQVTEEIPDSSITTVDSPPKPTPSPPKSPPPTSEPEDQALDFDADELIGTTFGSSRINSQDDLLYKQADDEDDQYEANSDGEELVDSDDEMDGKADNKADGVGGGLDMVLETEDAHKLCMTNEQPIPIEEAEKMILVLEKLVWDN